MGGTLATGRLPVSVVALRELLPGLRWDLSHAAVAVVDQIRATSAMVTALAHGARDVQPVDTPEEAIALREGDPDILLAGERDARPIPGFDFGNSPVELAESETRLQGRRLVMATTNGTRALAALSPETPFVWAFSLLNVSATAAAIPAAVTAGEAHVMAGAAVADRVVVLCSGTDGDLAQDDLLAAGTLCERLAARGFEPSGDAALVALDVYRAWRGRELSCFLQTRAGRNVLENLGHDDDLRFVAQVDRYRHVVRRESGRLVRGGPG